MADMQKVVEKTILESAKVIEEQLDAEIQKLENLDDDDLDAIRRKRIQALKSYETKKQEWLTRGHGEYIEITSEMEFFDACRKSENFVCHFYRDTTFRCKIVDKHLAILAKKHLETRFVKISVDKAPFLCDRLKIHILPTILLCKDAKSKDYIKGFDELGGHDEFSTEMLEWRIALADVINYSGDLRSPPDESRKPKKTTTVLGHKSKIIRGKDEDDSDDD